MADTNPPTTEKLFDFSTLWDNNPKLLQMLNQVNFSNIALIRREKGLSDLKAPYFFDKNQPKNDAYFVELFEGLNPNTIGRTVDKRTTLVKYSGNSIYPGELASKRKSICPAKKRARRCKTYGKSQ